MAEQYGVSNIDEWVFVPLRLDVVALVIANKFSQSEMAGSFFLH